MKQPTIELPSILGGGGVVGFKGRDVIAITDFKPEELLHLFNVAKTMEKYCRSRLELLKDKILALAFFEPSTRTMFSFQTAMHRLGGSVIWFSSSEATSIAKGENLADTIRMLSSYADAIVIRHRFEGAAAFAAEIADVPVINAGDGSQHHPTQAMIDLYTIWRERGRIEGLNVGVLGDLRYGRAAASFIYAISMFKPKKLYLISPELLKVRSEVRDYLESKGVDYTETTRLDEVIGELDVLYVTRVQKERFPDLAEYEKVKGSYRVDLKVLSKAKEDLMILHPLPRVDEIALEVDNTRYAYYFKQASYGVPVRMALLALVMGGIE